MLRLLLIRVALVNDEVVESVLVAFLLMLFVLSLPIDLGAVEVVVSILVVDCCGC